MSTHPGSNAPQRAWWVAATVTVAIVIYFLGFGLYAGLARNGMVGYYPDGNWLQNLYMGKYSPITVLYRTPLKGPLDWYMALWERLLSPYAPPVLGASPRPLKTAIEGDHKA